MQTASTWAIGKDNQIRPGIAEFKKLKPRALTDRTLFIECPNSAVMGGQLAKLIAGMKISDALIGRCGIITVRGPRWHYSFKTHELNKEIRKQWGEREGMFQNPIESVQAGNFYDETRTLYQVPTGYPAPKATIKFPTR